MLTDGEILKLFIENQRVAKKTIAEDLEMTRQNLYGLFESVTLTQETKDKFESYFNAQIFTDEARNQEGAPTKERTPYKRLPKTEQRKNMAPLVPVKAQAGYVRAIDQETFMDTLEQYALPPGVNPHGAIWRYWEVEGDSMEPAFHNGDIILTSQVHQMDWENLRNFYLYVIVTHERILFKRIFCKNALEWVLISENEEDYPQQLLPVEYIKEVWVFRRSIRSQAPPSKQFKITV